jgi:type II secretion system protein G
MEKKPNHAFTLIELLIVVAIIALLAGIALPNLLMAQTRSKVARVKSELRTLTTALESYRTDNNHYPASTLVPLFQRFIPLTTPVAYLSTIPTDDFNVRVDPNAGTGRARGNYTYAATPIDEENRFALVSDGPDLAPNHGNVEFYPGYSAKIWENPASGFEFFRYDPTNGVVSDGDIWRVSDYNME